jgi:hypothetical protein
MRPQHLTISAKFTDPVLKHFLARKGYWQWKTALKQAHFFLMHPDGKMFENYYFAYLNVTNGWQLQHPTKPYQYHSGKQGLTWLKRNYTRHLNIFPDMLTLMQYAQISKKGIRQIKSDSTVLINHRVNIEGLVGRFKYYNSIAYYMPDSKPINLLFESAILSNFHEAKDLNKTVLYI